MKKLLSVKRNLVAFLTLLCMLLVHIAALIYSSCLFAAGTIDRSELLHRVLFFFIGAALYVLIFAVERLLHIRFPLVLELVVLTFVLLSNTLATGFDFYSFLPFWDKVLHTLSGAVFLLIGLVLIRLFLSGTDKKSICLCVFFAFLFALAVGYVWELYEFTADTLTGSDLQMWSRSLIERYENGTSLIEGFRGSALIDTISDMYLNFGCATVFACILLPIFLKKPAAYEVLRSEKKKKQKESAQLS